MEPPKVQGCRQQLTESTPKDLQWIKLLRDSSNKLYLEMSYHIMPYIFRLNRSAVNRLRLSSNPQPPELARNIFGLIKTKILKKNSHRQPLRMKNEEKIKFIMRGLTSLTRYDGIKKFSISSQMKILARPFIRLNFKKLLEIALKVKKERNQKKIRFFQRQMRLILYMMPQQEEESRRLLEQLLQKQFPWTSNMFAELRDFAYSNYQEVIFAAENSDESIKSEEEKSEKEESEVSEAEEQSQNFAMNQCSYKSKRIVKR